MKIWSKLHYCIENYGESRKGTKEEGKKCFILYKFICGQTLLELLILSGSHCRREKKTLNSKKIKCESLLGLNNLG